MINVKILLTNYENSNTIRLYLKDKREYVVNNTNMKRKALILLIAKLEMFEIIYDNDKEFKTELQYI